MSLAACNSIVSYFKSIKKQNSSPAKHDFTKKIDMLLSCGYLQPYGGYKHPISINTGYLFY